MRSCSSCARSWFAPVVVLAHVFPRPPRLARVSVLAEGGSGVPALGGELLRPWLAVVSLASVRHELSATGCEWACGGYGCCSRMMRVWSFQAVEVKARGLALMSRSLLRRITRTFLPTSPRGEGSRQNASR